MNLPAIHIADYDYPLPDERIAKYPLPQRDQSKLLVADHGRLSSHTFSQLPSLLPTGALLVMNDTKVIRARLHFHKSTGAHIEVFLLEPVSPADYEQAFQSRGRCRWSCLIGNAKKWKDEPLTVSITTPRSVCRDAIATTTLTARRGQPTHDGHEVDFTWDDDSLSFADIIDLLGELPIPPYLNRQTEQADHTTYQTVYSRVKGSVAAPTAGLHFTPEVLHDIAARGIDTARVTLHVGAGTFRPVKTDTIDRHEMHAEHFSITRQTLQQLIAHRAEVVAVGTTSVRSIESLYYLGRQLLDGNDPSPDALHVSQWEPYAPQPQVGGCQSSGMSRCHRDTPAPTPLQTLQAIDRYMDQHGLETLHATTQIIIVPGYRYHFVKALITNFHQPCSTLLLLVSAFIGEQWREVYRFALENGYRFLSYGDSSLLIP